MPQSLCIPDKHETFTQCRFDVEPPFAMLAQHQTSIGSAYHGCREPPHCILFGPKTLEYLPRALSQTPLLEVNDDDSRGGIHRYII